MKNAVEFCFCMVLFTVAPAAFASAQSLDGFIESFRAAQVSAPMVRDGARLTVPAGVVRADVGDGSWPQAALDIPAVRLPDGTGAVMMSGTGGVGESGRLTKANMEPALQKSITGILMWHQ
jgi:hypothetical protein